jgi:hypothetical protein
MGVGRPGPEHDLDYCFDLPRKMFRADDTETTGLIDCWKAGHFAVEAKASGTGLNRVG